MAHRAPNNQPHFCSPALIDRRRFLTASAATFSAALFTELPLLGQSVNRVQSHSRWTTTLEDELGGPAHGPWRRLFLDGGVIESQSGLEKVFHAAKKHPMNPVIKADKPWEGRSAITGPYVYGTALRENGKFRLWYQVLNQGNNVAYAESHDGIAWTKPELGLIAFQGSRANNLVVADTQAEITGGHCHNPGVIQRPDANDPQRRYALYGFDGEAGHARVAYSADGLRWKYEPSTKARAMFTSSDVVNFCRDPYLERYFATWKTRNRRGRAVGVAWSDDGLNWTKPYDGPVFVADDLDPDDTQIYGMPAFPYQGMYIGLPWIYRARYFKYGSYSVNKLLEAQEDSPRTMDTQLAWSWDWINWTRPPERQPFIRRGDSGTWDDGMIVTSRAPVIVDDQLFFYYGGMDGLHDGKNVHAAIGLATLRLDGFCSMKSGEQEGWLISKREPFRKPEVNINARTRPNGFVTAEILDRHNRIVPGFSRKECQPFIGDSVRAVLRWKNARFRAGTKREDYKLRFWLKNAELFSYLPTGLDPAQPDLARFPQSGP